MDFIHAKSSGAIRVNTLLIRTIIQGILHNQPILPSNPPTIKNHHANHPRLPNPYTPNPIPC